MIGFLNLTLKTCNEKSESCFPFISLISTKNQGLLYIIQKRQGLYFLCNLHIQEKRYFDYKNIIKFKQSTSTHGRVCPNAYLCPPHIHTSCMHTQVKRLKAHLYVYSTSIYSDICLSHT